MTESEFKNMQNEVVILKGYVKKLNIEVQDHHELKVEIRRLRADALKK